jgi:hypothetical protein
MEKGKFLAALKRNREGKGSARRKVRTTKRGPAREKEKSDRWEWRDIG